MSNVEDLKLELRDMSDEELVEHCVDILREGLYLYEDITGAIAEFNYLDELNPKHRKLLEGTYILGYSKSELSV